MEKKKNFFEGGFKYVGTINSTFNYWETWIRNANWFLYREIYRLYEPGFKNRYMTIWKRSNRNITNTKISDTSNFKISINYLRKNSAKISVRTCENYQGVLDVAISCKSQLNDSFASALIVNRIIEVEDCKGFGYNDGVLNFNKWNLPSSYNGYVPITINKGYGEIILTAEPSKNSNIIIRSIKANNFFANITY